MFLTLLALSGCASVSLLHSAKDPAVTAKQYKKLLVVGIAERPQMPPEFSLSQCLSFGLEQLIFGAQSCYLPSDISRLSVLEARFKF